MSNKGLRTRTKKNEKQEGADVVFLDPEPPAPLYVDPGLEALLEDWEQSRINRDSDGNILDKQDAGIVFVLEELRSFLGERLDRTCGKEFQNILINKIITRLVFM